MKGEERKELVKGMDVVYIYHDRIDSSSHTSDSLVFAACSDAIEEIKNLVRILVNEFSAVNIFITSDHGFLYTYEELKEWYTKSGLPLKKFFNTSGMLYKEMGLKDKLKDMSEDEQLKLLATDGMLVKRPLVIGDDFVLTGFKEKEWIEAMHV